MFWTILLAALPGAVLLVRLLVGSRTCPSCGRVYLRLSAANYDYEGELSFPQWQRLPEEVRAACFQGLLYIPPHLAEICPSCGAKPYISDPQETSKCHHCGRDLPPLERARLWYHGPMSGRWGRRQVNRLCARIKRSRQNHREYTPAHEFTGYTCPFCGETVDYCVGFLEPPDPRLYGCISVLLGTVLWAVAFLIALGIRGCAT